MALTQLRAELTAIATEIEAMLAADNRQIDTGRLTDLLNELSGDRFANCLAVSPELRAWIDRLLARIARARIETENVN